MLTQEDINYCVLQQTAVDAVIGDDLNSIFYKFQELIPLYNRVYNAVPGALTALGQSLPKKMDDNAKATGIIVQYLGGQQILAYLTANGHDEDIQTFVWILKRNIFNIKLYRNGNHDVDGDAELLANIQSEDPDTKATAILYFLYYVRCNTVHGQKAREEDQRLLVSPVTRVLQTVKNQVYQQLNVQQPAQAIPTP